MKDKILNIILRFKLQFFLLLTFLIISSAVLLNFYLANKPQQISNKTQIFINNGEKKYNLQVEIAKTPDEQERGLMFRTNLDKDKGMIFVFDNYTEQSFWMKNTLIPLDILFFDKDGNLLNIANANPCKVPDNECDIYSSNGPSKYVLEVNKGWAQENKISQGAKLELSNLN